MKNVKNKDNKTLDDRALLEANVKGLKVLLVRFEQFPSMKEKIEALMQKLTFVSPKPDAAGVDKKIGDIIDDIRIVQEKNIRKNDFSDAESLIQEIKILIEKR